MYKTQRKEKGGNDGMKELSLGEGKGKEGKGREGKGRGRKESNEN